MTEDEINFIDDFGADASVDFVSHMANEMKDEIDNEIIKELMQHGAPSAVDRLAAIGEPDSEVAKRVADWDKAQETINNLSNLSNEIYKRTRRNPANWIKVDQSILNLPEVT